MTISRRRALLAMAGAAASRPLFGSNSWRRNYRANASITLLSVPIVARTGVGSGFASIEETGKTVSITFGAGSWPDRARGLNRLGFIRETVTEKCPGEIGECSYFAFMTTSKEESLDEARRALETNDSEIPYAVAEAAGRGGIFTSRLERLNFPSRFTWRDYPALIEKARAAMSSDALAQRTERRLGGGQEAPATFLYAVRSAMLAPGARTNTNLIYNGREYLLCSTKQNEANGVIRINATIRNRATGKNTPFKVWYEPGSGHLPPVRFEYQAKSFLRLTFEFDPTLTNPTNMDKENA